MSFTDLMSSGRGPGVIGMIMALIVLLGFGVLFMFAFDEGAQGGDQSIESVIAYQAKDIVASEALRDSNLTTLAKAPVRVVNAKELARLKREDQSMQEKIAGLKSGVEAGKAAIATRNAATEAYKDEYRALVRGKAKGEVMPKLETTTGAVYTNVNIREVTAVGIQIRHDDGQKRIPFEDLPESMKDHFQFDPKQKEKALAQETAAHDELAAAVAVTEEAAGQQAAVRRAEEAEALRKNTARAIAQKEARIESLDEEIERMEEAIKKEAYKTVSRAGIMRGQLTAKQRELAELRAQISSLQSRF